MSRWVAGVVLASMAVSSCSTAVDTSVEDQVAVPTEATQPTAATTSAPTATTLAAPTTEISIPQTDLEESGVVGMWWPSDERLSASPESPLVVLVPGGGWVSADPTGLVPLAEALAESGAIAVTITYRTAGDDVFFPIPARDVACAVAHAATLARSSGHDPGEVIVLGHSSGAQLGALVALRPLGFSSDCEDPAVTYDRFIGLAGPYDVVRAQRFAVDLFGPDNKGPDSWTDGNPIEHAAQQPELDVLLIHGTDDRTVPIEFTEAFAEALIDGGHAVDTFYPDGIDHHAVYSTEIAARFIASWLSL